MTLSKRQLDLLIERIFGASKAGHQRAHTQIDKLDKEDLRHLAHLLVDRITGNTTAASDPLDPHGVQQKARQPINKLPFSDRAYNALHKNGIKTVGELMAYTKEELATIPGIGQKTIEEIVTVLFWEKLNLARKNPGIKP